MAMERARAHLARWNRHTDIREFSVSSATVELAAAALGVGPERIAKSLTFKKDEGQVWMIVAAGDVKVDNAKFKTEFGVKARMLSPDEVDQWVGHQIGGVCPFGVKEGVEVYLDVSLQRFPTVFPACGSSNSGIELTCGELEEYSQSLKWVDVCKPRETPAT